MSKTGKIAACIMAASGLLNAVQAAVVVDFNPVNADYTDASWDNTTGPITNALSLTTPIFDSSTVAPIYGAYRSGGTNSDATALANIDDADLLLRQNNGDGAGDGNRVYQYGLLLWKAEDFSDTSSTTFDQSANSSFSITARAFSDGANFNETRFVILNNGTYYIGGEEIGISSGDIIGTVDGTTATWAEWTDPWGAISSADGAELGGGLTYSAQTFDNVEAVGFVNFQARDKAGDIFTLTDFQVSTIPEPATLGLIAAAGIGVVFVRRFMSI